MNSLVAGIGAGLVSALLFAVVITGSPLAMLLSYLAPLPVIIAALGWRHVSGLIAALAGALAIAVAMRLPAGLAYALGIALPAWGLAYLALLGRADERGNVEWYPLGRLLLWIVGASALIVLGGAITIAGDHETYRAAMQRSLEAILSGQIPGLSPPRLPAGITAADLAATLAIWAPFIAGASFVPMLTLNLWGAAKAVHASGRLPRPWPYLPALNLPREALFVTLAATVMSYGPGFVGFFGMAILGAMTSAFMINGLAATHELSLGKPWRVGMLAGIYVSLFIAVIWIAPLLAILGFVDCGFRLRERVRSAQPPTIT